MKHRNKVLVLTLVSTLVATVFAGTLNVSAQSADIFVVIWHTGPSSTTVDVWLFNTVTHEQTLFQIWQDYDNDGNWDAMHKYWFWEDGSEDHTTVIDMDDDGEWDHKAWTAQPGKTWVDGFPGDPWDEDGRWDTEIILDPDDPEGPIEIIELDPQPPVLEPSVPPSETPIPPGFRLPGNQIQVPSLPGQSAC